MTWENMIIPVAALGFALAGWWCLLMARKAVSRNIENKKMGLPPEEEPEGPTEESLLKDIRDELAKRNT